MKLQSVQKRIIYIWMAVIILLSVSVYFFVFMPINTELSDKKDSLEFEKQKYELLIDQSEEQQGDSLPVTTIKQSIPETMEEEGVIQLINRASENANTLVQSYQYLGRETIDVEGQEVEQLTMQINGSINSISNLNSFIKQLETSKRLVNVNSLDFQNREEAINFQTEFNVYSKSFE